MQNDNLVINHISNGEVRSLNLFLPERTQADGHHYVGLTLAHVRPQVV